MPIASCPTCATVIEVDHVDDELIRLAIALGTLLITASMIRVALAGPGYESTLPGFSERMKELSDMTLRDGEELQSWGEAFDGEDEGPN